MTVEGYCISRVLKGLSGVDTLQAVGLWPVEDTSWPWWASQPQPRRRPPHPPPPPQPPFRPSPLRSPAGRWKAKITLQALHLLTDK